MKKTLLKRIVLNVLLLLALSAVSQAQSFAYNQYGDVLAGFRKTGVYAGNYELVVNLGSVTNFLNIGAGNTVNITNFTPSQLSDAFADYNNLQWSVFCAIPNNSSWVTPVGSFPKDTLWYTLATSDVNTQSQPLSRNAYTTQAQQRNTMLAVGGNAYSIAGFLGVTNTDCNAVLVREPVSYNLYTLSASIGDQNNIGNFGSGGTSLSQSVENITPSSFNTAVRSDFYQMCPTTFADPITHLTTGNGYFMGYFILNPNGTMTFTRAGGSSAPVISLVSSLNTVTNGFAPLQVVFTNAASGSITNWVWNFGDGNLITNSTGGNITNSYAASGNYTVTLIVNGPAGSSTNVLSGYIKTYPKPQIIAPSLSGGKLVFNGTNCPAGVQYRILTTTNLAQVSVNWVPVYTNTFTGVGGFSYTNSMTNTGAFYRLVSP